MHMHACNSSTCMRVHPFACTSHKLPKVECPALSKAMAVLGVTLKGVKALRTTLLEQLYSECKAVVG